MISIQVTPANQRVALTALFTTNQNRWAAALALPLVVGPVWCLAWQRNIGWLGTLSGFVLLAVLVTSAVTDYRQQKIYNWATYSAFLWALAINFVATSLPSGESTLVAAYHRATMGPEFLGGVGLGQCLAGAALCFIATLAGYHLSSGGAGDVKLATAIGSFLGVHDGLFAVGYSYIVAAIAIVAWSIYHSGPLALVKAAGRAMGAVLGPLWPFPPRDSDAKLLLKPIPLGPYFLTGTMLVVLELVPT